MASAEIHLAAVVLDLPALLSCPFSEVLLLKGLVEINSKVSAAAAASLEATKVAAFRPTIAAVATTTVATRLAVEEVEEAVVSLGKMLGTLLVVVVVAAAAEAAAAKRRVKGVVANRTHLQVFPVVAEETLAVFSTTAPTTVTRIPLVALAARTIAIQRRILSQPFLEAAPLADLATIPEVEEETCLVVAAEAVEAVGPPRLVA